MEDDQESIAVNVFPNLSTVISASSTGHSAEDGETTTKGILSPSNTNITVSQENFKDNPSSKAIVDKKIGSLMVLDSKKHSSMSRPPIAPTIGNENVDTDTVPRKTRTNKMKQVKSSGYGRIPVGGTGSNRRKKQSQNSHNYASDDDASSVSSVGSVGSYFKSDMSRRQQTSQKRGRSASRSRGVHSAPSSPSSSDLPKFVHKSRSFSRPRANSGDRKNAPKEASEWAQKQREQQRQRQERYLKNPNIRDNRQHQRMNTDAGTSENHQRKLKRTAAMASPTNGDHSPSSVSTKNSIQLEERNNKSIKTSENSSPCTSAAKASRFNYDGTNVANEDDDDDENSKQNDSSKSLAPSSFRRTASGLLASWRSPTKKTPARDERNNDFGDQTNTETPRSLTSVPRVVNTPPRPEALVRRVRQGSADLALIDPASSEIRTMSEDIFANGSGISDLELQKLIGSKISAGKQWEVKKKLEQSQKLIVKLKESLASLIEAKNKFCKEAIDAESSVRVTLSRVAQKADKLEEDCVSLKSNVKKLSEENINLRDEVKDAQREVCQGEEKVSNLEAQIIPLKEALATAEQKHNEVALALAVAEGRSEEAAKQAESWRVEIASIEAAKSEAVKRAELVIAASVEKEVAELREECAALRTKMQARDEELGRLLRATPGSTGSHITDIKDELDRLKEKANESESMLHLRTNELQKALAEKEAAISRSAAKENDMSELMKSIGDIQRSAQAREDEANASRKVAEEKAAEMSRRLAEVQGEISVLSHEKLAVREALDAARKEIEIAESTITCLRADILERKEELSVFSTQLEVEKGLRARAEEKEQEERRERIALSAQMVAMTKDHAQAEARLKEANESNERAWRDKVDGQKDIIIEQEKTISSMKETITGLEGERSSLKEALNTRKTMADAQTVEENGRLRGEINVLKERLLETERRATSFGEASAERVRALEAQIREGQAERRRMHNAIQELRGNVRVFARVRPFLPADGVSGDAEPCVVPKNDTDLKIVQSSENREYTFSFDRVFSPSVGQEAVFEEVSEFVQSALDGYNVCLFSYGQTGSGKTHTMQGSGVGQMRGIIPRAIEQVGRYKHSLEKDGWEYDMKLSFLEIYNESIRDLLRDGKGDDIKHEIKVNRDGSRHVTDLTMKTIEPSNQTAVEDIMRQAAKHRSVASTEMNSVSSRSHSVFTLHLTALHREQKQSLKGLLNLVDLAGSERLQRSGVTGDRAKEAMAINKSLSSLTDVFVAIGKKSSHIPFRNSKLTYLLQPSLSGDGKTLMMANISPTDESFQESVCSLRFAAQVNKCELGKARRALSEANSDIEDNDNSSRCSNSRPPSARPNNLTTSSPGKKLLAGNGSQVRRRRTSRGG